MALRADELRLQLALGRVPLARERRRGEHECEKSGEEELHRARTRLIAASILSCVTGPTMCGGTTRPCLSTKKVSGYPVTP